MANQANPFEGGRRPTGRPRKVTAEKLIEIATLRGAGIGWSEIAQRLGLKAETSRRAAWAAKNARRAVGNPPDPVNNPPSGG